LHDLRLILGSEGSELDSLFVCVHLVPSTATLSVTFSFAARSMPDKAVEPPGSDNTAARCAIARNPPKMYVSGWKGLRLVPQCKRRM